MKRPFKKELERKLTEAVANMILPQWVRLNFKTLKGLAKEYGITRITRKDVDYSHGDPHYSFSFVNRVGTVWFKIDNRLKDGSFKVIG